MIWLAWRQHRRELLFALVGLAAVAAIMGFTGWQMHRAYNDTGLADCFANPQPELVPVDGPQACGRLAQQFGNRFDGLAPLAVLFMVLPVLVGIFFGAPLVAREVALGTHRLIWTQGVTRLRWVTVKIGLVGSATLILAVVFTAWLTWWLTPLNNALSGRLQPLSFDLQGVVPVAYTIFALALGIFAGTVWRKVLPAMAVTVVTYTGARLAVATLIRPHYKPPRERRYSLFADRVPNRLSGDWIFGEGIHDAAGREIAPNVSSLCDPVPPSPTPGGAPSCVDTYGAGAYNLQVYQPAGRFWLFQTIESAIFVGLAVVLLAVAIHQVRRRLS